MCGWCDMLRVFFFFFWYIGLVVFGWLPCVLYGGMQIQVYRYISQATRWWYSSEKGNTIQLAIANPTSSYFWHSHNIYISFSLSLFFSIRISNLIHLFCLVFSIFLLCSQHTIYWIQNKTQIVCLQNFHSQVLWLIKLNTIINTPTTATIYIIYVAKSFR